jgi:hypothetical protein
MRQVLLIFTLLMSSLWLAAPLAAQALCPADDVRVVAWADTISVEHWNAERNCCYELAVDLTVAENVIDFYEGSAGEPCRCDCCFDLNYSAGGFAAGHYTVRVWNGDGTELFASVEVDVAGDAGMPGMLTSNRGECVGPTPADAPTWGFVKEIYK